MKRLLIGVAAIAALAIAGIVGVQLYLQYQSSTISDHNTSLIEELPAAAGDEMREAIASIQRISETPVQIVRLSPSPESTGVYCVTISQDGSLIHGYLMAERDEWLLYGARASELPYGCAVVED